MSNGKTITELRNATLRALDQLSGLNVDATMGEAKTLVEELRNAREYEPMAKLAEAVSRIDPKDATNRRLYAQSLIETGKVSVAIDVLQALARRLPKEHKESLEAAGLLGRAHKQIFFDARDKGSSAARQSLKQAIAAYRKPFEDNPANTWHGVNLIALLANSRRLGIATPAGLKPREIATQVIQALESLAHDQRNEWYLPTLAEAYLGLDDWDAVERHVRAYAATPDAKAFLLASTLRQFTKIWNLEDSERGRGLVDILRAKLMRSPGGECVFSTGDVQRLQQQSPPSPGQLEAVLGEHGAQTFNWWKTGLTRALSVASIRARLGSRIGTGFLVRAGDLGMTPADELVVLTNFHVVNEHGASPGIQPDAAEIVFEATDTKEVYLVDKLLWSSPPELCDASVLRTKKPVTGIEPLEVAKGLPTLGESAQVYVVGYPGGRDLSFSFQDNELLDHEGPPVGKPQINGVCRVHYRAPTEGGSSGSPVFNASLWQVIALHHKGGKVGMPRLNGITGTYPANEGISLQCIAAFPKT